jgi:hypothetical protein
LSHLPLVYLPEVSELPDIESASTSAGLESSLDEASDDSPASEAADVVDMPLLTPPVHSLQPPPPPAGLERYSSYPHMKGKAKAKPGPTDEGDTEAESVSGEETDTAEDDDPETDEDPRINDDDPDEW